MKNFDVHAGAAKLELALKTFRTTFAAVDPQWTDAARRDFQETHLRPWNRTSRTCSRPLPAWRRCWPPPSASAAPISGNAVPNASHTEWQATMRTSDE